MKIILFFITTVSAMGLATFSHAQTLPAYLPTNGLVAWWPFNENANDESGNEMIHYIEEIQFWIDHLNSGQYLSEYDEQ